MVVYITFCLIGVTTFGQQKTDFARYGLAFARLFELMVDKPEMDDFLSDNLFGVLPAALSSSSAVPGRHSFSSMAG